MGSQRGSASVTKSQRERAVKGFANPQKKAERKKRKKGAKKKPEA